MLKPADYVRMAKEALGNADMTDRQLGELLGGIAQPVISQGRYGKMSDPLALRLAEVIPDIDAGEVLMVARLAREKDETVKAALTAWAVKTLAAMPKKTGAPDALGGMVASLSKVPSPSQDGQGGVCIM
ncbi:MAG: hypothetical protein ACK4S6_16190 [Roseateles asaccharophilus]|uniref:hypothetical protein n=1 Tax=Roseateles asaccharophilus TaxID=582607 RepID=UPI00391A2B1E